MTKIEKSIEINAPPEKIWALNCKLERLPEWQPEFKTSKWTSMEKCKVGSTLHLTGEAGGFKADMDLEITDWKENEKMAWRTSTGTATGFGSVTLSPTKAGTKYTTIVEYELPYSVLGKIIDKLRVHKAMEKSYEGALKNLKAMAEK